MGAFTMLLASAAIIFGVACGDSEPGVGASPTAEGNATPGLRPGAGMSGFGRERKPSGLVITIDSCTWKPAEADGPIQLNVVFTVLNEESVLRFANYRVQNTTGTIYRPTGVDSDITVNAGETDSRTLQTAKFAVGAQDLSLVFSDFGRPSQTVPLDQCARP